MSNLITYRKHYEPHWQSYLDPELYEQLRALPVSEQISLLDLAECLARQENQTIATLILQRHVDAALFREIKESFPTIEAAWIEIARLRKLSDWQEAA